MAQVCMVSADGGSGNVRIGIWLEPICPFVSLAHLHHLAFLLAYEHTSLHHPIGSRLCFSS